MSDFSSFLDFKVAKWANAYSATSVTLMTEEVQLCQTCASNCWLGYSGKKSPKTNNTFLCLKLDITALSAILL